MSRREAVAAFAWGAVWLAGCGTARRSPAPSSGSATPSAGSSSGAPASSGAGAARLAIPAAERTATHTIGSGYVTPLVVAVRAGATIAWHNTMAQAHTLVSFPGAPTPFRVSVPAGGSGHVRLLAPGIYRYYCPELDVYSTTMRDAKARPGSPGFPVPLRGTVVVLGATGTLPAPASASAAVAIPSSTMAFTPWAAVVRAGTTITWTNHDADPHAVRSVPGYATAAIGPITLNPNGGQGSATIARAGIYYYYCSIHAQWNASRQQLVPLKAYGMYPFIMDGLVVAVPV